MKKLLVFTLALLALSSVFILSGCKRSYLNIKFDYGYNSIVENIIIKEGSYLTAPELPVRDGYEFAGWYEDEKLEKEFNFSKPVKEKTTIYADWVSNEVQKFFSWKDVDGGIKLHSIVGGIDTILPKDLIIPRVIEGQKVLELGNGLFAGQCYPEPQYELTTVKIPYGITKIGDYAFRDCYNLESVSIPESVTDIGIGVFKFSSNFGMVLKKAVLSPALTKIPSETFYNCSTLESVTIPAGITDIGKKAFYYCKNLTKVALPNGLQTIGENAFDGCNELTNLVLPNTLHTIGAYAFHRCFKSNLKTIPSSVVTINTNAFAFNLQIRYLDIPTTVITMGKTVFNQCPGAILRTTLTKNAAGWNAEWNKNTSTIYDSKNNNLSSGVEYFIQDNCKYALKTSETDNHKYLSLEFCFNAEEKVTLNSKVILRGIAYPVEEINRTAFNPFHHSNVRKLIINEGVPGTTLTIGEYSLHGIDYLEYIVLPTSTQPLSQRVTYTFLYINETVVYTNLTKEQTETWTYKEDSENAGSYIKPTIYTAGEWEYINGEPTPKNK